MMAIVVDRPRERARRIRRANCGHVYGLHFTCESCGAIICAKCRHIVKTTMLCDFCAGNAFFERRLRPWHHSGPFGGDAA
jgi:hypothetical protein